MISRVTEAAALSAVTAMDCWYARKLTVYLNAYGVDYDFCQFYHITSEEDTGESWAMLLNSTLVVCGNGKLPLAEMECFITMHRPARVEGPTQLIGALSPEDYEYKRRTMFALNPTDLPEDFAVEEIDESPSLDTVYDILREGFPNLIGYDLWMTDTSHLRRRGLTKQYTYRGMTTASLLFDVDNHVLVGQVATRVAARGSGYARSFLGWLAGGLRAQGKTAVLYALDVRVSFYKEIGFTPIETSSLLSRIDRVDEQMQKGKLN